MSPPPLDETSRIIDDTDALLRKADALINRRRASMAGLSAQRPMQALPDDDIPVLTEVVEESTARLATAPAHMQRQLDALRDELARWLSEELPHAVLKVTDGLADRLMEELTNQAEQKLLPRMISKLDGSSETPR